MQTDNSKKATPRWFALINDRYVTMPFRVVTVNVLRTLGNVPSEQTLFRDYNSPDDEALHGDEKVDLADGNVFYSRHHAEPPPFKKCEAPAKIAYAIDDRPEIGVFELTAASLLEVFGLSPNTKLFRDFDSPDDQRLAATDLIKFTDGPDFYTDGEDCDGPFIAKVNRVEIEFQKADVTGLEIKEEAIKKVTGIKLDFPLFENEEGGKKTPIADRQNVRLERCRVFSFTCVAPDDNS